MSPPRRVVYVSYDGLSDPLGQAQVLPYVTGLADRGHSFELISFEKAPNPTAWRKPIYPGVRWTGLRYHKTPTIAATGFDMSQGAFAALVSGLMRQADLLHVRSYVAATLALFPSFVLNRPLLFDMRGLWPDERIEDGTWSKDGRVYPWAKRIERTLVNRADAITVLTNSMQQYLRREAPFSSRIRSPIHVIPTCADLELFTPDGPKAADLKAELEGHRVMAYIGSFGGRYLATEMAQFYLKWRTHVTKPRLLILSRFDPEPMLAVLREAGVADELVHRSAAHDAVPQYLRWAEAGVFFHPPTTTNRGAAPTKMGEMLACGLVLAGNQVGDVPQVLRSEGVGVALDGLGDAELEEAAQELARLGAAEGAAARARAAAERWFSLAKGLDGYEAVYAQIGGQGLSDRAWPPA